MSGAGISGAWASLMDPGFMQPRMCAVCAWAHSPHCEQCVQGVAAAGRATGCLLASTGSEQVGVLSSAAQGASPARPMLFDDADLLEGSGHD